MMVPSFIASLNLKKKAKVTASAFFLGLVCLFFTFI